MQLENGARRRAVGPIWCELVQLRHPTKNCNMVVFNHAIRSSANRSHVVKGQDVHLFSNFKKNDDRLTRGRGDGRFAIYHK